MIIRSLLIVAMLAGVGCSDSQPPANQSTSKTERELAAAKKRVQELESQLEKEGNIQQRSQPQPKPKSHLPARLTDKERSSHLQQAPQSGKRVTIRFASVGLSGPMQPDSPLYVDTIIDDETMIVRENYGAPSWYAYIRGHRTAGRVSDQTFPSGGYYIVRGTAPYRGKTIFVIDYLGPEKSK